MLFIISYSPSHKEVDCNPCGNPFLVSVVVGWRGFSQGRGEGQGHLEAILGLLRKAIQRKVPFFSTNMCVDSKEIQGHSVFILAHLGPTRAQCPDFRPNIGHMWILVKVVLELI